MRQPLELKTDTSFYELTCLPCHHSYVVASSVLAVRLRINELAFGYAKYQSAWPEQSPLAISRLTNLLSEYGIKLRLPAYDITSKVEADDLLREFGLTSASLEQKCLQQVRNVTLSEDALIQQVGLWERAIRESVSKLDEIEIQVIHDTTVEQV
ncbi:hypothetical protein [Bradyrhizobium viridifuturi]|uniref:hypothetical protein n=1 Tax=Bradyrhizobium viridifuturi TaxID=1654716 RepID=UPI000FE14356|nr:hypothetical protein [Bradyrhizobium viridifuturi]